MNAEDAFSKLVDEGPVEPNKLLKDDEILDADDRKRPEPIKQSNGEAKPKKPCANCTCGLADQLDKKESSSEPKSSCGSCHLGDAFRCASCPYKGMPAFKPGEKVTIDTASDDI